MDKLDLDQTKTLLQVEVVDRIITLNDRQLEAVARLINQFSGCELCGKPIGPKRVRFCKACTPKSLRHSQKKFYYSTKQKKLLTKNYDALITQVLANVHVPSDQEPQLREKLLEAIRLIAGKARGFRKEQILAAALILLGRQIGEPALMALYPCSFNHVAELCCIPVTQVNAVWNKIRRHVKPLKSTPANT